VLGLPAAMLAACPNRPPSVWGGDEEHCCHQPLGRDEGGFLFVAQYVLLAFTSRRYSPSRPRNASCNCPVGRRECATGGRGGACDSCALWPHFQPVMLSAGTSRNAAQHRNHIARYRGPSYPSSKMALSPPRAAVKILRHIPAPMAHVLFPRSGVA